MKIAFFSPLGPQQTGISNYAEELVLQMRKFGNVCIDLFVDGFEPSNKEILESFDIHQIEEIDNAAERNKYDHLVYQVGNNSRFHKRINEYSMKHPGITQLHDFSLHHYLAETTLLQGKLDEYVDVMKFCHGWQGEAMATGFIAGTCFPPWDNRPLDFPVNKHMLDRAKAVVVHSDFAVQMLRGMGIGKPIKKLCLHARELRVDYDIHKRACREMLNIKQDALVFGSFGFATPAKRIEQILQALARLKKERSDFIYMVVGKVVGIDLDGAVEKLGLSDCVLSPGYLSLEQFEIHMSACDVCFNLRFPSHGETSGTLHQLLGLGKVVIVTRIAAFDEYPEEVVLKVRHGAEEVQEIYDYVKTLVSMPEKLVSVREKALAYAKAHCCLKTNCGKYIDFLAGLDSGASCSGDYEDELIDRLFELGLFSESYTCQLANRLSILERTNQ